LKALFQIKKEITPIEYSGAYREFTSAEVVALSEN
jgi:hypothetical protein